MSKNHVHRAHAEDCKGGCLWAGELGGGFWRMGSSGLCERRIERMRSRTGVSWPGYVYRDCLSRDEVWAWKESLDVDTG